MFHTEPSPMGLGADDSDTIMPGGRGTLAGHGWSGSIGWSGLGPPWPGASLGYSLGAGGSEPLGSTLGSGVGVGVCSEGSGDALGSVATGGVTQPTRRMASPAVRAATRLTE